LKGEKRGYFNKQVMHPIVSVPGNIRLKKGTAGLPKTNVIVVSKIATVGKLRLLEKIGTLSRKKNEEVIENCRKVISLKMF